MSSRTHYMRWPKGMTARKLALMQKLAEGRSLKIVGEDVLIPVPPDISARLGPGDGWPIPEELRREILRTALETAVVRPRTESDFGRVILQAAKLATHCDVPNELLQDGIKEFGSAADFFASIWHQNEEGQERWRRIRNDYTNIKPYGSTSTPRARSADGGYGHHIHVPVAQTRFQHLREISQLLESYRPQPNWRRRQR